MKEKLLTRALISGHQKKTKPKKQPNFSFFLCEVCKD